MWTRDSYPGDDDFAAVNKDSLDKDCHQKPSKECAPYEAYIKAESLAVAYVANQHLCSVYGEDTAICKGTVFPELYKPYAPRYKKTRYAQFPDPEDTDVVELL